MVEFASKPRRCLAPAQSRSVWSAWSLLPLSMTRGVRQREQAPRTPNAPRGSVAALPRWEISALALLMIAFSLHAAEPALVLPDGASVRTFSLPGETSFIYPSGPRGQDKHGFRVLNDSAAAWQG